MFKLILALLFIILIPIAYFNYYDSCENEIYKSIPSPSNNLKAVIFSRNCGATTDFNTQMAIIEEPGGKFKRGNVLILDREPSVNNVSVSWISENSIFIDIRSKSKKFLIEEKLTIAGKSIEINFTER